MSIVNTLSLESNRQIKINFDGGDLSSDAGLLLIKEFVRKLGIDNLLGKVFKTNDSALFRYHTDQKNLLQMIYMIIAGYFEDDTSDELTNDPVFKSVDEYLNDYPAIRILLRGDSGFATPDLYKQCEENGTSYVIRLKENGILRKKASYLVDELDEITKNNKVDYAVAYGEFMYRASCVL